MCLGVVLDHNGEEDNEDDTDDKQRAYKSIFDEENNANKESNKQRDACAMGLSRF